MLNSLLVLFTRDLTKLKSEISSYKTEANLWRVDGEISNSGGNLSLHLVGNLNHFIGATLGNTGYVRERDAEFAIKDVSSAEILEKITATQKMLAEVLPTLSETDLQRDFPIDVFGRPMSIQHFLLHLLTHLNYHLGQISYHRRLLDL